MLCFPCKCRPRELITSMKNDAVGLLDYDYSTPQIPPKYVTFYRVFKEASENKRSSKPFGLLPFGASLGVSALTPPE